MSPSMSTNEGSIGCWTLMLILRIRLLESSDTRLTPRLQTEASLIQPIVVLHRSYNVTPRTRSFVPCLAC